MHRLRKCNSFSQSDDKALLLELLLSHYPNGSMGLFDSSLRYCIAGGSPVATNVNSIEDFIGKTVSEIFDIDLMRKIEPPFKAVFDDQPSRLQVSHQEHTYEIRIEPIKIDETIPFGIVLFQDITEREAELEKKEKALLSLRKLLESSYNTINDIMLVMDKDHQIIFSNLALDHLPNGIESTCHAALFGNETACADCDIHEIFKDGKELRKIRNNTDQGKIEEITAFPVFDDHNNVQYIVEHIKDVTKEKQLETIRKNFELELERAVTERTRLLDEANRELRAFGYTVSHDLKAPLRHIAGFSNALEEDYGDYLPPKGKQYLNKIKASVARMQTIIDELSVLSRISDQNLRIASVSMNTFIRSVAAEEQEMAHADVEIKIDVEESNTLRLDEEMFRIALKNLISNAIKYTRKTQNPKIMITGQQNENSYLLKITDNGIGFDMDKSDRLFQPFTRLHNDSDYPGTGIGLATVRRILLRHNGIIWANSHPGEGSTFFLSIPLQKTERDMV